MAADPVLTLTDAALFGHDPTPGIVSVCVDPGGGVLVWRRTPAGVVLERDCFRPWLYARDLNDLQHLGDRLYGSPEAPLHVRELPGEPGSLRYLVTARDFRRLRQEVLTGASRRTGTRVTSLHDLGGYLSVGLSEQYLMASGRTSFKGLSFDEVHRLQFDLETTSLSPETGRIFMVSVRDNRGLETVLEARWKTQEAALISGLLALIRDRDPDVIENHNLMRFDLPFLMGRAELHGLPLDLGRAGGPPGLWRVQDGGGRPHWACAGREIVDTYDAVRRLDLPSAGLKAVSQHFGLAPPGRVYLEGDQIARTYRHDPERVRTYALQDVQEVDALARRVLAPSFALAQLAPRPYHRLPYAGPATGVLEPMMIRAYLRAGRALPGPPPAGTGRHLGGAVRLYAEGVLHRVVKADVASMYPSLIRAGRIGPRQDDLGVFLHLMDHLTERRLHHKQAARRGEAGEHEALQQAMKLVVNAGYGYLGAGRLSLWGDAPAADRVTAEGRRVLGLVTTALQRRGLTLIEADTDGVYFSVPDTWTEAQERALIRDIGTLLPDGVTLEHDGRWAAMLSHETKNYVLLGYEGQLTVRGAAFQSSRSEAYGQRFLDTALRRLLAGDVPGVRQAYLDTLQQVQARELRNRDVSTRVRLLRTQEAYLAGRSGRKEAAYEALLGLNRAWEPGERVTLYRRERQGLVPLDDPEGADYDAAYYAAQLLTGYASRLRKAFSAADHEDLFAGTVQPSLFARPPEAIRAGWRAVAGEGAPGSS